LSLEQKRLTTPVVDFIKILQVAFAPVFLSQKITKPNCKLRKAAKTLLYEKVELKKLMKLTPIGNFINILRAAFTLIDPKSITKIDNLTVIFMLSGSLRV